MNIDETDSSQFDLVRASAHSLYPDALLVLWAGSSERGDSSILSDVDLLVVKRCHGYHNKEYSIVDLGLIEAHVHSRASLRREFRREVLERYPVNLRMCASGRFLLGDKGMATALASQASRLVAAGPAPIARAECLHVVRSIRAQLAALRDDHRDNAPTGRLHALCTEALSLYLAASGAWLGHGKHLFVEIRSVDQHLEAELNAAMRLAMCEPDLTPLEGVVDRIVQRSMERITADHQSRRWSLTA